jgi:hypothetical protein
MEIATRFKEKELCKEDQPIRTMIFSLGMWTALGNHTVRNRVEGIISLDFPFPLLLVSGPHGSKLILQ